MGDVKKAQTAKGDYFNNKIVIFRKVNRNFYG